MSEGIAIEALDAAFAHDSHTVLEHVNLTIRPGEFWFFLGANGQGKSTLLHGLLGDLEPRRGEIRRSSEFNDRSALGFVPQRSELSPSLPTTIREFVGLGLVGQRISRQQSQERLAFALACTGLTGTERKSYWSLSGGQRQRSLVARALVRKPSLLLVDEPMNHLDFPTEQALLQVFEKQNREEGLTIVFVTHDVAVALRHATHLALFSNGRVTAGPVAAMSDPKLLEAAFGMQVTL